MTTHDVPPADLGDSGPNTVCPPPGPGSLLEVAAGPAQLSLNGGPPRLRGSTEPGRRWRDPFCAEVGRRLLLAQMDFPSWVVRRVESVAFQGDRSVLRTVTVDLRVRDDAPVFVEDNGDRVVRHWLVPLTVMRRRTLVDFHLSDEDGRPIKLPGLRFTQQLDQAMLRAAAATASLPAGSHDVVERFIGRLIAGKREKVFKRWRQFEEQEFAAEQGAEKTLRALRNSDLFCRVARQMRSGFTLYVFLPVEQGRHRLLQMSFVEPIIWRPQAPQMKRSDHWDGLDYCTGERELWPQRYKHALSMLGLRPMRLRFQTPSAERATSYHFELTAPEGVRIQRATLLAGRPLREPGSARGNQADALAEEKRRPHTEDAVEHNTLKVGLHGVEVPPGSLCRVQVDLRVEASGWIAAMAISGVLTFLVLGSIAWHLQGLPFPLIGPAQGTGWYQDVVLLLVTVAAGEVALVAAQDNSPFATRLVLLVRVVAFAGISCLVIAASVLAYAERVGDTAKEAPPTPRTVYWFFVLAGVSAIIMVYLIGVYFSSRWIERPGQQPSPWDMTEYREWRDSGAAEAPAPALTTYDDALEEHDFASPAIGLASAEAWHDIYDLRGDAYERMLRELDGSVPASFRCPDHTRCRPSKGASCFVSVGADRAAQQDGRGVRNPPGSWWSAYPDPGRPTNGAAPH